MNMIEFSCLTVLLGAIAISSPAYSSITGEDGSTLTVSADYAATFPIQQATIDPTAVFYWWPAGQDTYFVSFTFTSDQLVLTGNNRDWFAWPQQLTFTGFDTPITSLSIVSNTGFTSFPGFNSYAYAGNINEDSFTADSITLAWDNGNAPPGAQLVFDIGTTPVSLPISGSAWLFLTGILAWCGNRRKV